LPQGRAGTRSRRRTLATVIVTDIVGSTERASELGDESWIKTLDRHDGLTRRLVRRHRGRLVKLTGDGAIATFSTPADGVQCGLDLTAAVRALDLEVRCGVHAGECEERDGDLAGLAVHIASRVAEQAAGGEVLVSSTIRDLVAGGDFGFDPKGPHVLKGVPAPWELFAAAPRVEPASKTRVLLVDDHPLWRQTLAGVLEHAGGVDVVGEAADGSEAVALARSHRPDVVVMDIDMPGVDGVDATRQLLSAVPQARVLVLSSSDDRSQVLRAVRAGASGYLLKTAGPKEIADGVQRVRAGELVFPPALAGYVLEHLRTDRAVSDGPTRVCVLADSLLDRRGLARLLEDAGFDVVCSTKEAATVEEHLAAAGADAVAIDLGASTDRLVPIAAELRNRHADVGILVLARDVETASALELLAVAPRGLAYLLKDRVEQVTELGDAIRRIIVGETIVDPEVAARSMTSRRRDPLDQLTVREREVLALMAEGRSNQAIRERLHVSLKTVEGYVTSIFMKLGLEATPDDSRRVLAVIAYLGHR
jgi:DNA-binding NarL/FixJ family response regulator/class 3 adenylate cyclase